MKLETAISTIIDCYVPPKTTWTGKVTEEERLDLNKADYLTLSIACTVVETAITKGVISKEEFKSRLQGY